MEYTLRTGARVKGVTASVLGPELNRMYEKYGKVTPEIYIKEAEDPTSPIHGTLTWCGEAAAHQWRLAEARQIIRAVCIKMPDDKPREMLAHVTLEDGGQYLPVSVIVKRKDLLSSALSELNGKIRALVNSTENLEEMARQEGNVPEVKRASKVRSHLKRAAEVAAH